MGKNQNPLYIDRDILRSEAYRTLKRTRSHRLLFDFLARRQMGHIGVGKKKKWVVTNNGEIEFPFSTAEKMGYSRRQFSESRSELVEHGFLLVPDPGGIWDGHKAKYAISERWRKYGTEDFIEKTIKSDTRKGRGWSVWHDNERLKFFKEHYKSRKVKIKRRKK